MDMNVIDPHAKMKERMKYGQIKPPFGQRVVTSHFSSIGIFYFVWESILDSLSLYTTVLRRPFEPSLLLGHQVFGVNGDGAIGLNVVHMRVYRQCFYWRSTIRCQSLGAWHRHPCRA